MSASFFTEDADTQKARDASMRRLLGNYPLFAAQCLKIKTKAGTIVPFDFNLAQAYLHGRLEEQKARTGRVRAILGKGRQSGGSTYIGGRFYHATSTRRGVNTFILTHEQPATDNLFGMVERFHKHNPLRVSTAKSNAKELYFDKLDSGYAVGTAGTKAIGRSRTIQRLHGCLSPDTPIVHPLTGSLVPMGAHRVGDLVRTHTGAIAKISFISRQMKAARRVVLKNVRAFPLIGTDIHRFWSPQGWRNLGEFLPGDVLGYPVSTISDSGIEWKFRVPDIARPQGGGTRQTGPDHVSPNYDIGRVLGLYLAEGSIKRQWKSGVLSGVTFTVHEREVDRTIEWLKPLSGLFRTPPQVEPRSDSKTVNIVISSKSFAAFVLVQCGCLDEKRLPAEWRECGVDFVRGLIHGYLAGDGHSSKASGNRRISAPSIRSAITIGMRDALAASGYGWAGIYHQKAAIRHGRNEREQWILRLCGAGVDVLCAEMGWQMPPRKRKGYGDIKISGGYAWVPVVSTEEIGDVEVMDFEVDHPDHSYTTIHAASHNSEVAFWANAAAHFGGVVQAVPDLPDTEIILESTGAGVGGEFHERWQQAEAGEGDYIAIFIPWFMTPEYSRDVPLDFVLDTEEREYAGMHRLTMRQMVWRRAKVAELKDPNLFRQEYPATAQEMFQFSGHESFITPESVVWARKATCEGIGPLVIGADPARMGKDRFSLAWRRGRKVEKVESKLKVGTIEGANWLRQVIDADDPDRVFIDLGGVGAGTFDILQSWGEPYCSVVVGVNFGGSPQDPVVILQDGTKVPGAANRRAEMWSRSRDWLTQVGGADIPDLDSLQSDACGPSYTYNMAQQLLLEPKEKMVARGIRSPDEWDSVALTFAEPVRQRRTRFKENSRSGGPTGGQLGWLGT